ncbi:MAG TPA: hypothetical protein VEB21_07970 [Terriglobales bacterium]|nr:hypothetical protein [Terriglobales bacterium]
MRPVNLHDFYLFGAIARPMLTLSDQVPLRSIMASIGEAVSVLGLIRQEHLGPLPISDAHLVAVGKLLVDVIQTPIEEWEQPIPAATRDAITAAMRNYEAALHAELLAKPCFMAVDVGLYSVKQMAAAADAAIPGSLRGYLSPDAIVDLQEAGRCIVYDVPTAASFHIHRATESVIILYHQVVTGKPPAKKNWRAYIDGMWSAPNPPRKILGLLDHIRDLHRNPTTHSGSFVTIEEAIEVFSLSTSAIQAMLRDVLTRWP